MWQFSALLFLLLPGCFTALDPVAGPKDVSSHERGSLTVRCQYASQWQDFKKYWCRGAERSSCEILIQTNASKQLVKKNRVSIRDDQTNFIFTVTMEDLRMSDAGIYWCGITKTGRDPMFEVRVSIDPGSSLWRSTNFPETTISSHVYTQPSVTTEESTRITHFQPRSRKNLSLSSLSLHVLIKATSSLKGPESFQDLLPSSLREEDAEHLLPSVNDFLGRGLSVHLLP